MENVHKEAWIELQSFFESFAEQYGENAVISIGFLNKIFKTKNKHIEIIARGEGTVRQKTIVELEKLN
jgi:uncharacterized protein YbjQ (UPF0145 family)